MKKLLFTLLSGLIGLSSFGQTQNILASDIAQGEKLIEAYFTPMAESFGAGLNSGWYNTAKPHSLGGFDVTFTLNTVIIPNSAETFNIEDAGGTTFTSTETDAATIFGSEKTISVNLSTLEQFNINYSQNTAELGNGNAGGWDALNMSVIAYIYDNTTKEILQVEEAHLNN